MLEKSSSNYKQVIVEATVMVDGKDEDGGGSGQRLGYCGIQPRIAHLVPRIALSAGGKLALTT
jgi:hypothetical protein